MSSSPANPLPTLNPIYSAAGASLIVLAGLVYLLARSSSLGPTVDNGGGELLVHCAAGMRVPVEQIAKDYKEAFGVSIRLQYGGSNSLLSQIEVGKIGDLYLAADESYLQIAREKALVAEGLPLAHMGPVIIVPAGNPKQVQGIEDLLRDDVRVSLANPDQAAMGKVTRVCMEKLGLWEALEARVRKNGVFKPTVNDVANDVLLGSVDAGIVWDAVAAQFSDIGVVRSTELAQERVLVSVGILTTTKKPASALHFARFLSARDRGLPVFRTAGYQPVEGDVWSDNPKLTLFAGAVNRQALEPIVKAFQQRHGVVVRTVYNGCGILTAQMRAIEEKAESGFPDVYMACDVFYMDTVKEMFQDAVNVSDTQIVIAVQAGNPKGITSVDDLIKPGVRLAIGQPEQCTIGILSRRLLESAEIYDTAIKSNVVTETATSSLLIPSIATGAADAALVYFSDAQAASEKVDVVPIDSPLAQAIQPLGIATSSEQKQLGRLLFEQITEAREVFEAAGFRWRIDP